MFFAKNFMLIKKRYLLLSILSYLNFMYVTFGQVTLIEQFSKLQNEKSSNYIIDKVLIKKSGSGNSTIKKIRHYYDSNQKSERIVLDFNTIKVPKLYIFLCSKTRKIYVDIFIKELSSKVSSVGTSHYIKRFMFYPIDKDKISLEMLYKNNLIFDVFYLENPGRLVIDTKVSA